MSELSHENITNSVNKIMRKIEWTNSKNLKKLLFILFKMLHRCRILNYIQFNFDQFYEISFSKFLIFTKPHKDSVVRDLSKIWIRIINGSRNKLRFDTIDELMFTCAVYSIHFTNKLKKVNHGSSHFELTKIKKRGLLIIYFTLFAFPMIAHASKIWLHKVLKVLHNSFKKYFEKSSIVDLPPENQLFFMQYYLKSHLALNMPLSSHDAELCNGVVERLLTYSSLSNII
ncbi:hypothetical protein RF11_02415 [Thelohanellus kitauei]|uniref:Uncharacterized protein n=1 Tax=Thelohanellus kitauei TaxID=669202 RepID=A0A0C2JQM0_THEKT|nr:hypothetical protein RF11_06092 [Thelohanellus kitauei]KII71663.1 hypothetical protein RF11_02415 [Thelohanellus kitauei]